MCLMTRKCGRAPRVLILDAPPGVPSLQQRHSYGDNQWTQPGICFLSPQVHWLREAGITRTWRILSCLHLLEHLMV